MYKLHLLPKINLHFSAWLLQRINTSTMSLDPCDGSSFDLTPESVHEVFELPIGNDAVVSESTIFSESLDDLKFAEVYLLKPLSEESSKIEIECFQIAFVIYVVSNLLAPTAKHDYVTLDFLGSPANISTISSFNWCEFVLKHIVLAANKLNSDIASGASSIHMGGCHLFLQVFYLDHIDLGVYNKPKLVSPRIGLFDYESLKKMIDHLSAVNGIESSFFPPVSLAQDKQDKKDATSNSAAATRRQGNHLNVLTKTHASNTALSCSNPGPNDFARHLQVNPM
ncbi:hypothetical protein BRADI_1g47682v3, partial [Brachypodium distachyon]